MNELAELERQIGQLHIILDIEQEYGATGQPDPGHAGRIAALQQKLSALCKQYRRRTAGAPF